MKTGSTVIAVSTGGTACVGIYGADAKGEWVTLERASVIRRSQRNVMTLCKGPDARTVVEYVGHVQFPLATVAALCECDADGWKSITGGPGR